MHRGLAWAVLAGLTLMAAPAAAGPARLDGTWSTASLTGLERPKELKRLVVSEAEAAAYEKENRGKVPMFPDDAVGGAQSEWWEIDFGLARIRGQIRSSWIVNPADGQMPRSAAARARGKAESERRKVDFDNPEARPGGERCLPDNTPPLANAGVNDNYQFVLTRDRLAIYAEWMGDLRIVRIGDKRHAPAALRSWLGDSIGWWEGPTLVIETTNFMPAEVRAPGGDASADMRVIERLTRTGPDEITYTFSVTNPAVFTQTWQGEMVLHPATGRIFEFACHEGNYALPSILAGGRLPQSPAKPAATSAGP
jgi:hypothetical protein